MRSCPSIMLSIAIIATIACACARAADAPASQPVSLDIKSLERDRVVKAADAMLNDEPITVTAAHSPRSAGGQHDFFSEGDYWWPDSKNPDGPYIQRDGMTNPENLVE